MRHRSTEKKINLVIRVFLTANVFLLKLKILIFLSKWYEN